MKTLRNIDLNPVPRHERILMVNFFLYRIVAPMGRHLDKEQSREAVQKFADRFNLGYCDAERLLKGAEFSDGRFCFDTNFGLYNITLTA